MRRSATAAKKPKVVHVQEKGRGAEMRLFDVHGKNGFVTATKLGTTDNVFVMLQPKILLQQPNVLLTELNILFYQNVFAIPILTNDFVSITKPFFPWVVIGS